jgi:hypothetical protein
MKKFLFVAVLACISHGCVHKKQKDPDNDSGHNTDSINTAFFPVTSFIQGQMKILDSLPVTFLQITTTDGKIDSTWITTEKLKPLLQPFISDVINKNNLVDFFNESRFNDQSTGAITFTYMPKTALPDSVHLRRWDIYINPEKGTIKRIYIVKELTENGTSATQQLTWQTNKWANIVTFIDKPGDVNPIQKATKWVWDFNDD